MKTIRRFYVLDSFRGIAALLVCLYHMPKSSFLTDNAFINNTGIFVDLFFVLSGFVIYHNYKNRLQTSSSVNSFIGKRLKRLIPLHLFTLFVIFFLEMFKFLLYPKVHFTTVPFELNTMSSFWSQLFLLNSTPFFVSFNWNFPNWSISAEIIAYLVFAIFSVLFFKKKSVTLVLSITIISIGYVFYFLRYGSFNPLIDFNFSFVRGIIGFFVGVLVYLIRFRLVSFMNSISNSIFTFIEMVIIASIVYLVVKLNELQNYFFIYHVAFSLLLLIFSIEKGMVSKFLKFSFFQKFGLWSYSIYLNHIFVIGMFNMFAIRIFKIEGFTALICELLMLFVLCLYSSLTYTYIEKRFYKPKNIKENSALPTHSSEVQNRE